MTQYLIERHFGPLTPEQVQEIGSKSKHVAAEQFPDVVWEHSHAVQTADGLVTYCTFSARDERQVRDHAAAAGMPCDRVMEIQTVGPQDFD